MQLLFIGCRTCVGGWTNELKSENVIVERCEFSQEPVFDDMLDVVQIVEALTPAQRAVLPSFWWWHRKGQPNSYEFGLVNYAGRNWKIRNNYLHDIFEGFASYAVGYSEQTEISYNVLKRVVDNAVESEDHSKYLRVHHNYIYDVWEPFSYQPQDGLPDPESVFIYNNVVYITPALRQVWRKPVMNWVNGCFKLKPRAGFPGVAGQGFNVFNNTIYHPSGDIFSLSQLASGTPGFRFFNNLCVTQGLPPDTSFDFTAWEFSRNQVAAAPDVPGALGPGAIFAGSGGTVATSIGALGSEPRR